MRVIQQRLPEERDVAAVEAVEQVGAAQERGLARSGRADEAHDLVAAQRQRHAAQDLVLAEALDHALELEDDLAHVTPARRRDRSREIRRSVKRVMGTVMARNRIAATT